MKVLRHEEFEKAVKLLAMDHMMANGVKLWSVMDLRISILL